LLTGKPKHCLGLQGTFQPHNLYGQSGGPDISARRNWKYFGGVRICGTADIAALRYWRPRAAADIAFHYGVATMSEDDFEFEPEQPRQQTRGFVVNKSTLSKWSGLSPMTVDKLLADGGPTISKGTRKQGWQINTADFFDWHWRRKVAEVTDDPDAGSFTIAKLRDKESQTRLRDLQIAKLEGELIPVTDVEQWAGQRYGAVRSRLMEVPTVIADLSDAQREALRDALIDALADVSGYPAEKHAPHDDLEADAED
jgi:hypothetical protein